MKKLVVLTGAGISEESGIKTFRDSDGLWENNDITKVASAEGWLKNPELVNRFYNERRKQLFECQANDAHKSLVYLEKYFEVEIITQNVDDLHEQAGSKNVLHLHGELKKVRSIVDSSLIYDLGKWELTKEDKCKHGKSLRPHIVWFGESVDMIGLAIEKVKQANIILIIGSSLNVYPAASLINYTKKGTKVYIIDPDSPIESEEIKIYNEKASIGLRHFIKDILNG